MRREVRVGLVDSGADGLPPGRLEVVTRFALVAGTPRRVAALADPSGHGSALARLIAADAPGARLCCAQVFAARGPAPALLVATGLDWVVECGAAIVVLALGLRRDRAPLREVCARAVASGCALFASTPARGAPVYPAAYPGVVRVSGDARCAPGQVSHLATAQADFGACPASPTPGAPAGGASFAVGRVAACAARFLGAGGSRDGIAAHLVAQASYRGPERRGGGA